MEPGTEAIYNKNVAIAALVGILASLLLSFKEGVFSPCTSLRKLNIHRYHVCRPLPVQSAFSRAGPGTFYFMLLHISIRLDNAL